MIAGPEILLWFTIICADIPVEPEFVAAVAQIESGMKIGPLGRKGTFIGPMGLHKDFRAKWDIDNTVVNIRVGAWTLAKKLRRYNNNKIAALKKYNTKYNADYGKEVIACYKEFKRQKVIN